MEVDSRPPSRSPDVVAILDIVTAHDIRFMIVGSTAILAHGVELIPGDIDIVPALDEVNLRRVADVLIAIGAIPEGFGYWITRDDGRRKWIDEGFSSDLLTAWRPGAADLPTLDHLFRTPLGNLDIVPSLAGTYAELLPASVTRDLGGLPVQVTPAADLVARLRYSNRAKDQERKSRLEQRIADDERRTQLH